MNPEQKKALINAYKEKKHTGGVCCIKCNGNGRIWVQGTRDIESLRNRFNFSISINCAPDPSMREEWENYGTESFSFEVLEELTKGEAQTDREFSDDIDLLCELWNEKIKQESL